jgi:hypothetical protein
MTIARAALNWLATGQSARHQMLVMVGIVVFQVTPAYSQDFVVINSRAGSYPAGQTFNVGERIELSAGAALTLIASSGTVVLLEGPYSQSLSLPSQDNAGSQGALAPLAALVARAAKKGASLGAAREADEEGRPSNPGARAKLWDIDALRPGNQCIKGEAVKLVRPDGDGALRVTIWPLNGSARHIEWPSGKTTLPLEKTSYLASGTQLRIAGGKSSGAIILWRLPDGFDADAKGRLLLWLSARGCERQALQLAADIAGPKVAQK